MANSFYVSIKGTKQGDFKGETGKNQTQIPILGFSYGVVSPHDLATGQASGKRQHKPITIFKEWGVVSVQLFEALVTNEVLKSVIIDEVRTDAAGKEAVYMEIRLANATISEIAIDPERSDDPPVWTNHETERVSFVFQKIEIENKLSKSSATDDWEQRA
jgi:type VI secretion system secreted protein Hcp